MIKGLAHACFIVNDLEVSEAFFRDKLGLKTAFDFVNDDGKRFGVYLHVGGRNFIELFDGKLAERAEAQSFLHICLEVDDMDTTVAELRGRGVEVTDPTLGSDGSFQAWLKDPDGNPIELHHYTPESKQTPWVK